MEEMCVDGKDNSEIYFREMHWGGGRGMVSSCSESAGQVPCCCEHGNERLGVYFTFRTTQIYRFCSGLLHVSAVRIGHHQVGMLVHKKSKQGRSLSLQTVGIALWQNFVIIIAKTEL